MRHLACNTTPGQWWRPTVAIAILGLMVGCGGSATDPNLPSAPADDNPSIDTSTDYNPYDEVARDRWDNDPPARNMEPDRDGAAKRKQTTNPVWANRPWKAAVLVVSPEENTAADYLIAKSAVAYPLVTITKVNVSLPADTTVASGAVDRVAFINAVKAALVPKETQMGRKFDMLQLLHQFPHHVSWAPIHPMCIPGQPSLYSPESILMTGADAMTLADSPASFNPWSIDPPMPWYGEWTGDENWRQVYMVARLEGRDLTQVKAKIDLACAPATVTRPGVVVDGPGKGGSANNYSGGPCNIDTYWEHMWETDGLAFIGARGTKYGFPVKNDIAGYSGDSTGNCNDDASEMPASAYAYQTSSTFPVGYLVSFGRHSNADGRFGAAFPSAAIYTNLQFSTRSVVFVGESHMGFSLTGSNYGSTPLATWLDLPVAGVIAWKNEPCLTGIYHDVFSEMYVGRNAAFAEAAMGSFQWLKNIDTPFGVAWMTLR